MKINFAGYPIEYRVVGDKMAIRCKDVIGYLHQLQDFIEGRSFKFGVGGNHETIISDDGREVRIGCLTDTRENFYNVYNILKLKTNVKE